MCEAKYSVGDVVRVRELEDLKSEFGENINVPCSWIHEMDWFCGKELIIKEVFIKDDIGDMDYVVESPYYYLEGDDNEWCFDECVFEDVESYEDFEISISDII